jgi:hypothetical protein
MLFSVQTLPRFKHTILNVKSRIRSDTSHLGYYDEKVPYIDIIYVHSGIYVAASGRCR